MRKTLIALAATTGLLTLDTIGASAAPLAPLDNPAHAVAAESSAIQQADYYCGPRCEFWRHRHWEESHRWREHHYDRYGYYDRGAYGYYR